MSAPDPYDLDRFVRAQAGVYPQALAELRAGAKRSHWMWFVFPQLRGLGHSALAERYGISGLDEARAYLAQPLLGARLRECTALLAQIAEPDARAVFGPPDDLKLRSSLTLFAAADGHDGLFGSTLARWFGSADPRTLALLDRSPAP